MAEDGLLSDARSGKFGCLDVRMEERTCLMLFHYQMADDGALFVETSALDAAAPTTIVRNRGIAVIDGSTICHREIPPATSDARYVPAAHDPRLQLAEDKPEPVELCLDFEAFAGLFTVKVRVNGLQVTPYPVRWRWITPDEGYKLTDAEFFR